MGVARTSVGRTLNVKPVLSFTRFKGLVTARNHAARAYIHLPTLRNPLKRPLLSTFPLLTPPDLTPRPGDCPRLRATFFIASLHFHESRYGNEGLLLSYHFRLHFYKRKERNYQNVMKKSGLHAYKGEMLESPAVNLSKRILSRYRYHPAPTARTV